MGHGSGRDGEGKTLGMGQIRVNTEWEHTEWDAQGVEYRVGYTHGVEHEVTRSGRQEIGYS